jgi:2-haloacid dehalogenase
VQTTFLVTFDLFSTLIDSRTGGTAAFGDIAAARGWQSGGSELYDRWDAHNKRIQRHTRRWRPFTALAAEALTATYQECDLLAGPGTGSVADPVADVARVLDTVPDWPLWPDVETVLARLRDDYRVGVLSNVDDAVFRRTRVAGLVDADLALTSERLQAYKPAAEIYHRAQAQAGPLVHVASSARDVRGATEAGLDVVRVRRPGHELDPHGPRPAYEADGLDEIDAPLGGLVARR